MNGQKSLRLNIRTINWHDLSNSKRQSKQHGIWSFMQCHFKNEIEAVLHGECSRHQIEWNVYSHI